MSSLPGRYTLPRYSWIIRSEVEKAFIGLFKPAINSGSWLPALN